MFPSCWFIVCLWFCIEPADVTLFKGDTIESDQSHCDSMHKFLFNHQKQLKKSTDAIYEVLKQNEIEYDELLRYSSIDLRGILEESKLSKLHIGRLINLLRVIPESQIHKETKTNIIILSPKEQEVIKHFSSQKAEIDNKLEELRTYTQRTAQISVMRQQRVRFWHDLFQKFEETVFNNALTFIKSMESNDTNFLARYTDLCESINHDITQYNAKIQNILITTANDDIQREAQILRIKDQYMQSKEALINIRECGNFDATMLESHKSYLKTRLSDNFIDKQFENFLNNLPLFDIFNKTAVNEINGPQNPRTNFNSGPQEFDGYVCAGIGESLPETNIGFQMDLTINHYSGAIIMQLGITSSIDNCNTSNSMHDYEKGYTYFVDNHVDHGGHAYSVSSELDNIDNKNQSHFDCDSWKDEDVITMKLSYKSLTLEYYRNDIFIGKFSNLVANLRYVPVMATNETSQKFQLLPVQMLSEEQA
eukprot:22453_1